LIIFLLRKFITFDFKFDFKLAKKIIHQSLPVGLISILALLYFKVDTLILSIFRGAEEVGIYSLAYRVLENILVLWGYYMASVYPLLSKFSKEKEKYENIFKNSFRAGVLGGLGVLVIGWLLAPLVIRILGGEGFRESIITLRILLFSIPLFLVNNLFYHVFLVKKGAKQLLFFLSFSLFINIILNLIFIPRWGYIIAALNTLITEGFLLCFYLVYFLKKI
jgi:O-antigen/teichoic acid export membrane protein